MRENDLFHGFRVKSVSRVEEISADMIRMEFEKNGCELIWLDRADDNDNKTFGIAFRTVPDDDTGVFHILEHSVLCGSENFPVKEPFVDLLKSSLNTFLNAMTYPDKTVYPVCSRNDKDFYNLTHVYLDAVFKPLCVRRPLAFRQEGWHFEPQDDGSVKCNGVVYNEMKGAYASADRLMNMRLMNSLFPDNTYSRSSGGDPAHIAELTYEKFVSQHHKYYSPSNARIFLDGKIDADAIFGLIESYLDEWDRVEVDSSIPLQTPVSRDEVTAYYPVGPEEETEGRAMACDGWVFAGCSDTVKMQAASLLFDVLCGSNSSPLAKAVLDSGLAEDVTLSLDNGIFQNLAVLSFKNLKEENRGELRKIALGVIEKTIEEGVDRDELDATLNNSEFQFRQQDFGRTPKGLVFGLTMLDTWLYGADPRAALEFEETFAFLRKMAEPGSRYYEDLLKEIFIDCKHHASVCMIPSRTLSAETDAAETERCRKAAESWTPADRKKVEDDLAELRRFQQTPDSEEAAKSVPMLKLSDIRAEARESRTKVEQAGGVTVLRHTQNSNGIIYGRMIFDISDFSDEELHAASFLTSVLGEIGTSKHDSAGLQRIIRRDLGSFGSSTAVFGNANRRGDYSIKYIVSFEALGSKIDRIIPIVSEILGDTDWSADGEIFNELKQRVISFEKSVTMNGSSVATQQAAAMVSESANAGAILSGLSQLRWLQGEKAAADAASTAAKLAAVAKKIFSPARLVFSITGPADDAFIASMTAALPCTGAPGPRPARGTAERVGLGIEIPAAVGFAGRACLVGDGGHRNAADEVASNFATYDYLWNEVRVNGGAYGTGLSIGRTGTASMRSYRDPQPGRSIGVFSDIPAKLRELAASGDFEKYVISSIPAADPLLTPSTETHRDDAYWLTGTPFDYPQIQMSEILATDAAALNAIADDLEKALADSAVCIVGGREILEKSPELITKTVRLREN